MKTFWFNYFHCFDRMITTLTLMTTTTKYQTPRHGRRGCQQRQRRYVNVEKATKVTASTTSLPTSRRQMWATTNPRPWTKFCLNCLASSNSSCLSVAAHFFASLSLSPRGRWLAAGPVFRSLKLHFEFTVYNYERY